jgi:hypothetical protein
VKNKIKNRYTEATHFRDQNMIVIDIWWRPWNMAKTPPRFFLRFIHGFPMGMWSRGGDGATQFPSHQ